MWSAEVSGTFEDIGLPGSLQRPSYDGTTGAASGTVYNFKMGLAREAFVQEGEGNFKHQRFLALISKRLLEASGWTLGWPQKQDIVVCDGQTLILEHVLLRGDSDDLFYYCQCML